MDDVLYRSFNVYFIAIPPLSLFIFVRLFQRKGSFNSPGPKSGQSRLLELKETLIKTLYDNIQYLCIPQNKYKIFFMVIMLITSYYDGSGLDQHHQKNILE